MFCIVFSQGWALVRTKESLFTENGDPEDSESGVVFGCAILTSFDSDYCKIGGGIGISTFFFDYEDAEAPPSDFDRFCGGSGERLNFFFEISGRSVVFFDYEDPKTSSEFDCLSRGGGGWGQRIQVL
jgi:hypothetical protein